MNQCMTSVHQNITIVEYQSRNISNVMQMHHAMRIGKEYAERTQADAVTAEKNECRVLQQKNDNAKMIQNVANVPL